MSRVFRVRVKRKSEAIDYNPDNEGESKFLNIRRRLSRIIISVFIYDEMLFVDKIEVGEVDAAFSNRTMPR